MNSDLIIKKFGDNFVANEDTYHMGVHHDLAEKIAKRFTGHKTCLDACVGAGFMTLALAKYVNKVIAVDINPEHLEQARQNAKTASLEEKIEFIEGDVMKVLGNLEIDCAFLDPDWAKVGDSKENHMLALSQMVPPADLLLQEVFKKTQNVCLRLPKEFDLEELKNLPKHEVEPVYQDDRLKFYCIYFGDLIRTKI